ncbi:MAG: hypothetical protein ACRDT7_12875 [Microbacterium sp.]
MFSTMRCAVEGRNIAYRFGDLEPGRYSIYGGYSDPWDQWDDRGAKVSVSVSVSVSGTVVEEDHNYGAADEARSYGDVAVGDEGDIEFVLHSDPVEMGTVTADQSGAGTLLWRVPTDVRPGSTTSS